jgi:hypothetical protein
MARKKQLLATRREIWAGYLLCSEMIRPALLQLYDVAKILSSRESSQFVVMEAT